MNRRDESGRVFDVEIQIASHDNFRKRILYFRARNYGVLLEEGSPYREHRPVVGVVFTKFPIDKENEEILFDTFQIVSKHFPNLLFSEHLKLHFVVVPDDAEAARNRFETSELVDWLKTLNYPKNTSEEEMSSILTENPTIGETVEKTREFLASPEGREYVEGRKSICWFKTRFAEPLKKKPAKKANDSR